MKHSTNKNKYSAVAEDVDDDGIQDVLVKTADGKLVVVNGYTVRSSDYPYRQQFNALSNEERKRHGTYKKYLTDEVYGTPQRDPNTGVITYSKLNPDEDPRYRQLKAKGFRTFKPRVKTAYQLFTSEIVKPQIEEMFKNEPDKYQIGTIREADGSERPRFPNVLLAVAADAWNYGVIRPILQEEFKLNIPSKISIYELKVNVTNPISLCSRRRRYSGIWRDQ